MNKPRKSLGERAASWRQTLKDFIDNYYRLITSTAAVLITTLLMYNRENLLQDEYTAGIIALTLFLACLLMLATTERWTWRASGIFFVFAGDVQLYGYTVAGLHGTKDGDIGGWELAFVRASLAVGARCFSWGC